MASSSNVTAGNVTTRLSAMYRAGVSTVRARLGTVAALYGANAAFGLAFTLFAAMLMASLYAPHPLFDRAVGGDTTALLACLREGPAVSSAITWAGVALALVYFVVSEFLAGGLLERLRDGEPVSRAEARRRFGAGGAAHLGRFLRLWVWSWTMWIPAFVVLAIGAGVGTSGTAEAVAAGPVIGKLIAWLVPGLLLAAWAAAAADFARLLAVREPALAPRKTFFRAAKLVLRQPAAYVHFVSYVAAWLLASGVYVLLTLGHPYAGAVGALLLFVLRQVLVFARVALRVGAFGGQGVLLDG
jgi:hypothetical protein